MTDIINPRDAMIESLRAIVSRERAVLEALPDIVDFSAIARAHAKQVGMLRKSTPPADFGKGIKAILDDYGFQWAEEDDRKLFKPPSGSVIGVLDDIDEARIETDLRLDQTLKGMQNPFSEGMENIGEVLEQYGWNIQEMHWASMEQRHQEPYATAGRMRSCYSCALDAMETLEKTLLQSFWSGLSGPTPPGK